MPVLTNQKHEAWSRAVKSRADLSPVVYHHWLKEKGLRYGTAKGGWQTPASAA
jgi:hypothetical protein